MKPLNEESDKKKEDGKEEDSEKEDNAIDKIKNIIQESTTGEKIFVIVIGIVMVIALWVLIMVVSKKE